jgi:hypothetical protein
VTDLRSFQSELDDLRRQRDASRAEAIAHEAAAARAQGAAAAQENKLAQQARAATATLAAKLNRRVREVLGQLDDEAPFAALDPAVPLVLLPVRLETRFRGDELVVRIYPDAIHVEDHEPELTDQEVAAGRRYWETTWRGGPEGSATADAAELAAWRELAGALGEQRASWVARTMTPTGSSRPPTPLAADEPFPSPPVFPEPPLRTRAWARPAVAHALPDRWLALAFAGGTQIGRAWSKPLPDELPLGPDPAAAPPTPQAGGPPVPDELRWTVDLAAAEERGMVVHVPLPVGTSHVDRLVVLGVSGSIDAAGSAARLAGLLDEHHYTDGLAFLPQGTPTNNTAGERSGLASQRPAEETFPIERRPAAVAPQSNAAAVAAALGIDAAPLATVEHAADREQDEAQAMNVVLWPCTWEYWLEQLAQPELPTGTLDAAERQFLDHVRGRGPLPVLRIGRQPYGLLPATSLTRWVSRGEPPADVALIRRLISLRRFWIAGIPNLPVVRPGRGPDEGLLGVLGQEAVARGVRIRTARGSNVNRMLDIAFDDPEGRRQGHLSQLVLAALEVDRQPFLAGFVFSDRTAGLRLPLVAGAIGPDGDREAAAALARLRTAPNQDLLSERADPASARSLLYLLGRQSALAERVRAGIVLAGRFDAALAAAVPAVDAEIAASGSDVTGSELSSTSPTVAVSRRLAARGAVLDEHVGGTGAADGVRVSELVDREVVAVDPAQLGSALADYTRFAAALQTLEGVSRERLELLLGETLDCCSHRLDAWLTSVATRRLADLRRDRPTGIGLGAFGVVEDLKRRPARPTAVNPPAGVPAGTVSDPLNAGYIHAPSLGQAATAAVLRSAHISHAIGNGDGNAFAVELSSDRVRLALRLLEGVRTGQPLGAPLGYRLERELHEGHPGLELDEVIGELRRLAPPPAVNERPADPDALPPRNVCDGLVLQRMGIDAVLAAVTLTGAQQAERKDAVRASLESLAAAVDAVADLLLAEGVHQLVAGNPERAAASLETVAAGDHAPPDPEVARTPRAGHALTHRVIVAGGPSVAPAAGWRAGGARATAEPFLERWCGHLLGDLRRVQVRVLLDRPPAVATVPVVDTAPGAATGSGAGPAVSWPIELTFTLGKLGLGALDFVYETTTAPGGAPGGGTLLEDRAIRRARAHAPAGAEAGVPRIDPTRAAPGAPTLAAAVEMARALRALLGAARPARPEDFARPQDGARGTVDTADAGRRAAAAVAALDTAVEALANAVDTAAAAAIVRARLDALAGFGVGAFQSVAGPAPEADPVALASAVAEGRRRRDRASEALRSAADDAGTREFAALAEVFGADFRAVPLARPVRGNRFAASLTKSAALVADDPLAPADWVRRSGRVRPAVGLLDDVLLYSEALASGGPFRLAIAQLPLRAFVHADGTPAPLRWVALPFKHELGPDPVTSVVVHAPPGFDPTKPIAGLVVDEWPEVVPGAELVTGIAFHSDAPGARPPQTILLAVHPDPQQQWSSQILADVVLETLELAKLRLVDLEAVAWAGRFLPALYVPDGDVPGALTLDFKQLVEHWHGETSQVLDS